MFVELDECEASCRCSLYYAHFEREFLEETHSFYGNESEMYITQNSVPEYLIRAEKRLIEEHERADAYIPKHDTKHALIKAVEFELIGRYKETLVD
ncbi:hypothetical protein RFI_17865, partial [Reticulomyxa filosa]